MRSHFEQFMALGTTVVAVSQDDAEDVSEYWKEHKIPFPCLPDPEGKLKALYHQESMLGPLPAVFVIGKKGIIHLAHYGTSMKDIPTAAALLALIKEIAGTVTTQSDYLRLEKSDHPPTRNGEKMEQKHQSNIGKKFPKVAAKSLAGNHVSIPDSAADKITLVAVAFLRENQGQLDSWLNPFFERFGKRADFMFFEVPMISSGYKFMKLIIDGGMRGGLPEFKHKHVVTMYGDVEHYTTALSLDPRNGYAFLLDKQGVIRWQDHGYASQEKLDFLFEEAERLAVETPTQ